jgi:hypothetical protein
MRIYLTLLITIFTIISLTSNGQCKDSIYEKFGTTLPTQGGTWISNSIIFGDSVKCPGLTCSFSKQYYLNFNGFGDYIRTPLIPNQSNFSFWYKRSGSSSLYHQMIVETSPDNTNWTTQSTITTFTTTYVKVSLVINNVYVRIRDNRSLSTDTKVWYLDDVKWDWENVGVWTGGVSSDWDNASNWCKGQIPTSTDNVLIPTGTLYNCVLSTIGNCKNLTIQSGTTLTVGGTLKVGGEITSTSNLNVRSGTIELNGTSIQTIKGSNLTSSLLGNLIVSNTSGISFGTVNTDTLKLLNSITFTTTNSTLTTGGSLTLCSSDTLTARIGEIGSNRIIGDVIVERCIPNHIKAWQFLSVPTIGATINSTWQEGNVPLGNINSGYGALITGNFIGSDILFGSPSMKIYNSTTNVWEGITNTASLINTNKGYMVFVRGDRSVTSYTQPATSTILRTKGMLYTPVDNPPPTINVLADKYESVNNFYTSAIDFSKLTRTGGVQNTYYVWDPKLTSSSVSTYGYGAYQTFVWNGVGYDVVPGGGSYANGNTNIESGLAFFVKSFASNGTLSFTENSKTTTSNLVTRNINNDMKLSTSLSVIQNGNTILIDGVLSKFGSRYSNTIDDLDISKIGIGITESISIIRNGIKLTSEWRKNITKNDTIFFNFNQLKIKTYELNFQSENMDNINSVLVDNFLGTTTPISLSDCPKILFSVTSNTASASSNRFYIIISRKNIQQIKENVFNSGTITASPNPVITDIVTVKLDGFNLGKYKINIVDAIGNIILSKYVFHMSKQSTHTIQIGKGFKGIYKLILNSENTKAQWINLIIK